MERLPSDDYCYLAGTNRYWYWDSCSPNVVLLVPDEGRRYLEVKETIYLYEPQGYSPGYAYRDFNKAVAQLLKDEGYDSLDALSESLEDWSHEFDVENKTIYIDDGARITSLELR